MASSLAPLAAVYLENAFRVLRLPVDATEREVRARAREQAMQLELGGADAVALQRVRAAESALDDPRRRLREELFAPHLAPGLLAVDLDVASAPAVEAAREALSKRAESGDDVAAHDLAVVEHAAAILAHPADARRWRMALDLWRRTWAADGFWLRMRLRAEALADPRANEATVDALRRQLPATLLEPSAAVAAHYLDVGAPDIAAGHVAVIVASSFPAEPVATARAAATAHRRAALDEALDAARDRLRDNLDKGWKPAAALRDAWRVAKDGVLPHLVALGRVDPEGPEVAVAIERGTEFLRGLSVRLHNDADLGAEALEIIRAVLALPLSDALRARYTQDERTLNYQVLSARAIEHFRLSAFDEAIAAATAARAVAPSDADRRELDQFIERCRQAQRAARPNPLSGIPRWAWTLGFVALLVLGRAATSGSSSSSGGTSTSRPAAVATVSPTQAPRVVATTAPARPNPPPAQPAPSIKDDLRRRLDSLKQDIDRQRPELERRNRALDDQEAEIEDLESQLNRLRNQYPSGAPPDAVSRYERLRRQYNDLVDAYNRELQAVQTLNRSLNDRVDEYNRLLEQYRSAR